MFTGIIEEVGTVSSVQAEADSTVFTINAPGIMDDVHVDDSICVNGCCLTVTNITNNLLNVRAISETLKKTTLGEWKTGDLVNLERAVRADSRLGGHIVQGHVDTTGTVTSINELDQGIELWISFPQSFSTWIIPVGSICVDGISLTVAELKNDSFKVAIIPHTLSKTTIGMKHIGNRVNLEFDVLAKYIQKFPVPRH